MNKQELLDYLKNNDFELQTVKATVILSTMVYESYVENLSKSKVDFNRLIAYFRPDMIFSQITPRKYVVSLSSFIYSNHLKDSSWFSQKVRESIELDKKIDAFWKANKPSIKKFSNAEMLSFSRKILKLIQDWWAYGIIGEDKGDFIKLYLVPAFAKRNNISEEKATQIISNLSHPVEPAAFTLERIAFLEICEICSYLLSTSKQNKEQRKGIEEDDFAKLKKDKKLSAMIDKYIDEYFWFKTDFYTINILTPEDIVKQAKEEIKNRNKQDIDSEIAKIKGTLSAIKKEKQKMFSSIKLSKQDKLDIGFAEQFTYWVDFRKVATMKQFYYGLAIAKQAGERFGIRYDDIVLYSKDQVLELIEKGTKLDSSVLKKRRSGFMILFERGKNYTYIYGDDVKHFFELIIKLGSSEINEIKGAVASKGKNNEDKITGIARVIFHPEQEKLKDGEILVTSMTRIEFVPLMRKAKAIVTDEGGVACHAAIVSRELGIPCIIGTKNATKVLKDGDFVEVDAEAGVVRKLS